MLACHFHASDYRALLPALFVRAIDYVTTQDLNALDSGRHTIPEIDPDDAFFMILDYQTTAESPVGPEFHHKYCDVQFIIQGEEQFGWTELTDEQHQQLSHDYHYDQQKDICFFDQQLVTLSYATMSHDQFYLFTPRTAHMPNLSVTTTSQVRKVVIKIKYPA
ncbi:YhcH/YjgK/YiaL family protein [Vibrio gazogenes]|uniref:YhcH/YjgK/YiaL family protein n=1 Tax=Vibrio gazogenes DSM 21264 = NBRC 103151 TaxID=1123492 RepID=A0A1M5CIA7_VIBGA|nr:YhcH/YjgK/YiaL family protein [Vibrio gazogenes]USP14248.1 YhcH/YjgK/YiaL family protein [Vibrio gazogenes]SHF54410.1 YhcH/YjgK/YiaL family protein [Vibrio gazogenes DSM 21264] [Vibrio gazogenes DSM 21264 = NBRC 103151]SJN53775.1 Toxin-antitoxin biofilm protein TabA [Vibrio gazogenes]